MRRVFEAATRLGPAVLVAAIVGLLFPYVTLRLGFGPNVSLVATLLGSLLFARGAHALHAAQAAGVAAGQTAFMGVALAAFDLLHLRVPPLLVFVWLAAAGTIGVLAALPMRRHFLDDERLAFAAGEAAAETIVMLEKRDRSRVVAFVAALGGGALMTATPASAIAIGSGMLLHVRVALSLAAGVLVGKLLLGGSLALVVWPASGLMLGGGLASVLTRAPAILRARPRVSVAALAVGAGALAILCVVDRVALGLPVALTLSSVAVAMPLLVVGTRVLGETNWAPVAVLGTAAQAALAPLVPGCAFATMVGSTVAAAIPNGGVHMMQSLRVGALVGARPRDTAIAQLVGVGVGSAALAVAYPLMSARFGVSSGGTGLWSPLSASWAEVASAFARGAGAMPEGALAIAIGAAIAGAALAFVKRAPSPTALGMGMLMPVGVVFALVVGSVMARFAPRAVAPRRVPVAAGLIAGEAITACARAFLW